VGELQRLKIGGGGTLISTTDPKQDDFSFRSYWSLQKRFTVCLQ